MSNSDGKQDIVDTSELEKQPRELVIQDRDNILNLAEQEDLEGDLKEIYELVREKVTQIVSTGKFTADHIRPLLLNVVEIIQEYTQNKYDHIDGAQKKAMALNIFRHIIVDLHRRGQVPQEHYETIMLSLEIFGGPLIDLAKGAWKFMAQVVDDVAEKGCSGCIRRNCR